MAPLAAREKKKRPSTATRVLQFFGGRSGESSASNGESREDKVCSDHLQGGKRSRRRLGRGGRNARPRAELTLLSCSFLFSQQLPSNFIIKNLDEKEFSSSPTTKSTSTPITSDNVASTTSSPSRPQFFIGSAPPSPSSSDDGSHHELGSPLDLTILPTFNGSPRRKGRPPAIRIPGRDEEGLSLNAGVGVGGKKKEKQDVFGGAVGVGMGGVGMGIDIGDVCEYRVLREEFRYREEKST